MNESIIEYKVKLINQYLNKDYSLDDTTTKTISGEKVEYFYIDEILINSIEKSLMFYEPLLIMGTTEKIENRIDQLKDSIKKFKKTEDIEIDNFIKNYEIDIRKIEKDILYLVNQYLKS